MRTQGSFADTAVGLLLGNRARATPATRTHDPAPASPQTGHLPSAEQALEEHASCLPSAGFLAVTPHTSQTPFSELQWVTQRPGQILLHSLCLTILALTKTVHLEVAPQAVHRDKGVE